MKKIFISACIVLMHASLSAQTRVNANVYPSNLEENVYFESYDAATGTIKNLNFLILADGDNSKHVTPAFEVSLYVIPNGSSSREDVIVVKTYKLDGLYHMGSREFKNENISLSGLNIAPGMYRLGIWANSNQAFEENTADNAILVKGNLRIGNIPPSKATPQQMPIKKKAQKDDDIENDTYEENDED